MRVFRQQKELTESSDIDVSASRKLPASSPEPPMSKRELSHDSSMPEEGLSLGEINTDFDEEVEDESEDDTDGVSGVFGGGWVGDVALGREEKEQCLMYTSDP